MEWKGRIPPAAVEGTENFPTLGEPQQLEVQRALWKNRCEFPWELVLMTIRKELLCNGVHKYLQTRTFLFSGDRQWKICWKVDFTMLAETTIFCLGWRIMYLWYLNIIFIFSSVAYYDNPIYTLRRIVRRVFTVGFFRVFMSCLR